MKKVFALFITTALCTATFLPVLHEWFTGGGETLGRGTPTVVLAGLTALGLGSLLSGARSDTVSTQSTG